MAKPRKKPPAPELPPIPQVGDKVYPPRSEMVYEISKVHHGGEEVDLHVPGTNLERFRVRTDSVTFVERKPPAKTSNPFPDGTCPKVVGAQLQRDELAFGRAEENGTYLLSTWQLLTTMLEDCPSFMATKRSNLDARERGRYRAY